jgi:hypothetical protein
MSKPKKKRDRALQNRVRERMQRTNESYQLAWRRETEAEQHESSQTKASNAAISASVYPIKDELAARRRYEKQKRLMMAHNKAILDHLQEIGVAIVGVRDGEPHAIGSGTCIKIGPHFLIATAAHVIEEYPDDKLMLITQQERQEWTPRIIGRGVDRTFDVAWLEIHPEVAPELRKQFVAVDRLLPRQSHLNNDLVIVYGFPAQRVQLHREERGIGVQSICFSSQTLDEAQRPAEADPLRDTYVEYPEHDLFGPDGAPMVGIPAPGLSGGGIWTAEVNKDGIWSPQACRLIAIEHSWAEWKYVRGTQIQHWLALVNRDFALAAG